MGTQKLGLGPNPSFNTEDRPIEEQRAIDEHHLAVTSRVFDRYGWFLVPFVMAAFLFLCDWGGYRGHDMPWGDPKPLADVWWHFPLIFLGCAVFFQFYRSRNRPVE